MFCVLQLSDVQEVNADWFPVAYNHFLSAQLPGRVQQQGSDFKIREQRDEHPTVQLFHASLLVAQFHGRFHLVFTVRW